MATILRSLDSQYSACRTLLVGETDAGMRRALMVRIHRLNKAIAYMGRRAGRV